jgi:hypothetical protein
MRDSAESEDLLLCLGSCELLLVWNAVNLLLAEPLKKRKGDQQSTVCWPNATTDSKSIKRRDGLNKQEAPTPRLSSKLKSNLQDT